mmetsp:Transcript_67633/g.207169  ORF Transcript_67633/g.207169 Transcript_67633/m.207169 type:complete len:243 (-) Transcript_67633:613-1341(-)
MGSFAWQWRPCKAQPRSRVQLSEALWVLSSKYWKRSTTSPVSRTCWTAIPSSPPSKGASSDDGGIQYLGTGSSPPRCPRCACIDRLCPHLQNCGARVKLLGSRCGSSRASPTSGQTTAAPASAPAAGAAVDALEPPACSRGQKLLHEQRRPSGYTKPQLKSLPLPSALAGWTSTPTGSHTPTRSAQAANLAKPTKAFRAPSRSRQPRSASSGAPSSRYPSRIARASAKSSLSTKLPCPAGSQ